MKIGTPSQVILEPKLAEYGHFFEKKPRPNGRSVFTLDTIPNFANIEDMGDVDILLILNRNENIIPGISRLNKMQAAAYFMLGETNGTSAGGKDEKGKSLRVPGTNPFFPLPHAFQGNRFLEILNNMDLEVFLLNTGRIGGGKKIKGSKKVKLHHSSAFIKAAAEGTIVWDTDPDFGYETACSVPGIEAEDVDLLQPQLLYQKYGKSDEYADIVKRLKKDRLEYMNNWPGINPLLIEALM